MKAMKALKKVKVEKVEKPQKKSKKAIYSFECIYTLMQFPLFIGFHSDGHARCTIISARRMRRAIDARRMLVAPFQNVSHHHCDSVLIQYLEGTHQQRLRCAPTGQKATKRKFQHDQGVVVYHVLFQTRFLLFTHQHINGHLAGELERHESSGGHLPLSH